MSTPDNKQIISIIKLVFWAIIYTVETIKRKDEKSPILEAEYAIYALESQIKKELNK